MLQQYLPFTVLKLPKLFTCCSFLLILVATVLTVYGIETHVTKEEKKFITQVATVLTVYGIETKQKLLN